MSSRTIFLADRCKGCMLCSTVCPKSIIIQTETLNRQGYKVAGISDMGKCTGCGSCSLICPDMAIRVFTTKMKKEQP